MISRNIAIVLAIVGIISAIFLTKKMATPIPAAQMQGEPAKNPFANALSASGIIEASNENIFVDTPEPGVVSIVYKEVCQPVKKGDPLFSLDSDELLAEEEVKQARVEVAKARLARIQDQFARLQSIEDQRAISINELKTKENDALVATSELGEAIAELGLIRTKIGKRTVCSPQDGIVIQKRAKVGEYLLPHGREPAYIIGDLNALQIRADIDEQNASRLIPGTKAVAFPKNRPDKTISLTFVRIEPFVIPKKSLTGMSDERVDTRVLQVIYTFEPPKEFALYVGQQVDVFIEMEAEP